MPLSTHLNLQHPKLQKSELVNPQPSTPNLSAACWKNVTSQICKVSCRPARVQFPSNPIATRIMQQAYYGSAPGPAPTATQQGYGYGYGYGAPQGQGALFRFVRGHRTKPFHSQALGVWSHGPGLQQSLSAKCREQKSEWLVPLWCIHTPRISLLLSVLLLSHNRLLESVDVHSHFREPSSPKDTATARL